MRAAQWVRLGVLSFAVMSGVGVMAVVACGPAASASQSGSGDKESPTATPYPDDCFEFQVSEDEFEMVCSELGPRQIQQLLRKEYNPLMVEKELVVQEGRRSVVEAIMVQVLIRTTTTDAVDDVVAFLQANGAGVDGYSKDSGSRSAGRVVAYINIELLPGIISIEGVGGVVEVYDDPPSGANLQSGPAMTALVGTMLELPVLGWRSR